MIYYFLQRYQQKTVPSLQTILDIATLKRLSPDNSEAIADYDQIDDINIIVYITMHYNQVC